MASGFKQFLAMFSLFFILTACSDDSGSSSQSSSVQSQSVQVVGKLSMDEVPTETAPNDHSLAKREVFVTDAQEKVVGQAVTGNDGSYAVAVPAALAIETSVAESEQPALGLYAAGLKLRSVISDTPNGDVIGIDQSLDFSGQSFINLGETPLKKVTAIRGRVMLDGARDHTGIVVYVPGTSFVARTDSSGQFLMTFIAPGSYDLKMEKDGYIAADALGVTVTENETAKVETRILQLSGGTSAFVVKQVGQEGLSASREVEFLVAPGSADRFKAGLINEVEAMEYGAVPDVYRHTFEADGTYTLKMIFANADGFESSAIRTIIVDTVAPIGDGLALADRDSLSTSYTNEKIVIGYHDSCLDIDKIAVTTVDEAPGEDEYLWDCHVGASDSNSNFVLPEGTASYSYYLWVKDKVGNKSLSSVNGTITLDQTAPAAPSFTLTDQTSGSESGTDITTVNVTLSSCEDIAKIIISESQVLAPEPKQFSAPCSTAANAFTHTFGNNIAGTKNVLVWALDPAGNVGPVAGTKSMILDQTAPALPTVTISDMSDALTSGYSNSSTVAVTLSDCDDITEVLFSQTQTEKPSELDTGWKSCATSGLTHTTTGEGNLTIYTWVKDIGGNISESKATGSIAVDITPPSPSGVTFTASDPSQGSTLATNETTVNISVSPCGADVTQVLISESSIAPSEDAYSIDCSGASLATTYTFVNNTEEVKTLYLWIRDIAGNVAASAKTHGITYDITDPSLPASFQLQDTDTSSTNYTNSTSVDYAVAACASNTYLLLSESQSTLPTESDAAWASCATSGTWSNLVTSGAGTKTVYLWVKDEAGNIQNSSMTDTIDWDSSAPSAPTLTTPSGAWGTEYTQSNPSNVVGTAEANASIRIQDTTNSLTYNTTADGSGNWSYSLPLTNNSTITIGVTATDEPGNVSSTTTAYMAHDTIAPTASSVSVALTDVTADISFNTSSDLTIYTVDYGLTTGYGSSVNTGSYSTSHTASITGLTEGTTYYYRIRTTDRAGNVDTGNDVTGSFKTYISKTGNISSNETWSDTSTNYYVGSNLTIDSGSTVTISAGVTVRVGSGRTITIDGKIDANGSSGNRIVFEGNGATSTQRGYWNGFIINSTSTALNMTGDTYNDGNRFNYVDVKNAGTTLGTFYMDQAGIYMNQSTVQYNGSSSTSKVFEFLNSPSLYMANSTISNITGYIIYASNRSGAVNLTLKDSEFQNATREAVYIYSSYSSGSSVVDGLNTIGVSDDSLYMWYDSSGVSCSVQNSIIGKSGMAAFLNNCSLSEFSRNILLARSSSSQWGIQLSTSGSTNIKNNVIIGAGQTGIYHSSGGAFVIENNHFIENRTYQSSINGKAIDLGGGSSAVTIRYNLFYNNTGYSSDNKGVIAIGGSRAVTMNNNNFYGNDSEYVLFNEQSSAQADWDSTSNWWGTTNSTTISDLVYDFDDLATLGTIDTSTPLSDWDTTAPVSQVENLSVTNDGGGQVTLTWDANPESDLGNYKVYYDTDSSEYPYEGTGATQGSSGFSAGNVVTTTVTGLTTGQTYYFTVTALDSSADGTTDILDGNESWFSSVQSVYVAP